MMKKKILFPFFLFCGILLNAQVKWVNVDSFYHPLPSTVHVYKTTDSLDGKPNIAYYLEAELKDKHLDFTVDTTKDRRITPQQYFERNGKPLLIVNCTFFSLATHQNLNVVIKDGRILSRNLKSIAIKSGDTIKNVSIFRSAIGISRKRKPDIAWIRTDSTKKYAEAVQEALFGSLFSRNRTTDETRFYDNFNFWKVETAVGGGPVIIQNGDIKVTNEEERMFTGKAIEDKHPRTAMGYTKDNKLVILLIQGRFPGISEGATLRQEAQLLKNIGCLEALNLDGGGSSCMLINGKETIKPSDKEGQRPVPAVFMIRSR